MNQKTLDLIGRKKSTIDTHDIKDPANAMAARSNF